MSPLRKPDVSRALDTSDIAEVDESVGIERAPLTGGTVDAKVVCDDCV